ncbi:MAG TPA: pitrilysin family protein [Blastocatellia bacterium]|nr:pitrilysin family protein [Blastocatellia bacterium]
MIRKHLFIMSTARAFGSSLLSIALLLSTSPSGAAAGQRAARKKTARASRQPQPGEAAEGWRKTPPRPGAIRPFRLPDRIEKRLDNNLSLVLIEDHRSPIVTLQLGIPTGSANDPEREPGLAEATAQLLTEGAGGRSAEQLAREIETIGGRVSASAGDDYTNISASVVGENAERLLEIFGDVALRPTFPESELEHYKKNRIQVLTVQRQEPEFLVSEQFNRIIYGAHPYAVSSPTPESVGAMTRAGVERFYRSSYTPDGSVLVIVGDFDASKIEAKARAIFGSWKAPAASRRDFPEIKERTGRRVYLIDRPGSEQADFRIGNLAVSHADPDYFPLLVANAVLGDGASSRLFLNIREQKGYAYDVSSALNTPLRQGTFFGMASSRTEVTLPAIREMLAEFDRLRGEEVPEGDLRNAKNYLNGMFSLILSTQGGIAGQVVQMRMLGLRPDYLESFRARVEAVTARQVMEATRKYITSDRAAVVVVGDASKLKRELETVAPVEVFDIEGKKK